MRAKQATIVITLRRSTKGLDPMIVDVLRSVIARKEVIVNESNVEEYEATADKDIAEMIDMANKLKPLKDIAEMIDMANKLKPLNDNCEFYITVESSGVVFSTEWEEKL